jgi:hypothetical protein
MIHIKRRLAAAALVTMLAATAWAGPAFDAIGKVKDKVPYDYKKRVWYSGK